MDGLTSYSVSKAIILVEDRGGSHYLMSVKRDQGSDNDGKMEFLGGRMEPDETPAETMARELAEEEATGGLSALIKDRASSHIEHQLGNATHFLFSMELTAEEYEMLSHHPDESYGFRLVEVGQLVPHPDHYTRKTMLIIEQLELS